MLDLFSRPVVRFGRRSVLVLAGLIATTSTTSAAPIPVGAGDESATVVINFSDGAIYEFDVSFTGPTTTGEQLLRTIDTALPSFVLNAPGAGGSFFVDAISYDGHTDGPGFTPPEGWWHYWTRDSSESAWASSWIGAGIRTIDDGYFDAWVFGTDAAPVPEPATASLAGVVAVGLLARRRRA